MDSRIAAADLSAGNRELLQALAIEASTILENARLLEEERAKQRIDEELRLARSIQQSLLPRTMPSSGWFRAAGWSEASHQVGGDYFDVFAVDDATWAIVVADVSGKGVGSALLASLLQGAFVALPPTVSVTDTMARINWFLGDRTEGEKYATIFYGRLSREGVLRYINAGHCPPLLVHAPGSLRTLSATAMPVGLFTEAEYEAADVRMGPGDKLIIYSDGVTEARNCAGEFFGTVRLREAALRHASEGCLPMLQGIRSAIEAFTGATLQADDITLVVLEYRPE
jgi:sigma-B regulation protein RsbU (phosphoserine phosphatase)